jgi:hypothetical protein
LDLGKTVLFADASKYNAFGSEGHNYVWRKVREEFQKNDHLAVKHGGNSVGSMAASVVGNHFNEGIMKKCVYVNILHIWWESNACTVAQK